PPLWRAYLDAVRYFGLDGWFTYGRVSFRTKGDERTWERKIIRRTDDRFVVRTICHTPAGDLWQEVTYYRTDPPTTTRKWIKDLPTDFPKLRYFFPPMVGYDPTPLQEQRQEIGEDAALGAGVGVPGLQNLFGWFDGGLEAATYAYYDHYDLLREFVSWQEAQVLRQAEMILEARPDFFLLGASGLWTMQSPKTFRDLSLPTLKKITRMCKEAGIPSFLHSCGKQREMIEILVRETDLNVVNPLEPPPMGDCDLAEIKQKFGDKIALMGNLHTTKVMLHGTPEEVEQAARAAIEAAGKNGGFVLSTGDQCGRDTPDENIFTLVRVAREYGQY
ncbi:MAG TPA: hypothetical protein EYP85_01085, partial [Armatimonadetes bacterium]|nr:hypothetical protein [Armatimonadota bacterium]